MKMLEDWLDNPKPEDGCQKIVMMIAREEHSTELLKNFSWEAEQMMTAALKHVAEEGEEFQPEEQLIEDGYILAQEELTETNMSEEEVEQQFIKETPELKSTVEWKTSATRGDEDNMRYQVDLPIQKYGEEEVQIKLIYLKNREFIVGIRRANHWRGGSEQHGQGDRRDQKDDVEVSRGDY
jgi:hypothetical protein